MIYLLFVVIKFWHKKLNPRQIFSCYEFMKGIKLYKRVQKAPLSFCVGPHGQTIEYIFSVLVNTSIIHQLYSLLRAHTYTPKQIPSIAFYIKLWDFELFIKPFPSVSLQKKGFEENILRNCYGICKKTCCNFSS